MLTKDFDFLLPEKLIAQYPAEKREGSRLLVLGKEDGEVTHGSFTDITKYIKEGDVVVFNDTRVFSARLIGKKRTGGAAEVLLVRKTNDDKWLCMAKPLKSLKEGVEVLFGDDGELSATFTGSIDEFGLSEVTLKAKADDDNIEKLIDTLGHIPLPPYIKREAEEADKERYQTSFANVRGAIAAPTAGLHFTERIIEEIRAKGASVEFITLHTGPATFLPVKVEHTEDHKMSPEVFTVPGEVIETVIAAKKVGRKVFAVGSTVVRTLETVFKDGTPKGDQSGESALFITPGFEFKAISAMITNFHLPKSTLVMMVAAFAGRSSILNAYKEAVKEGYNFFSYGDCMLII
ncbi:MAG: tRNA preQ1(34) S-adenosylmethionine ribosyltransferase-isomerase QueA [Deltaproteobacteria bacterium]|nr:tRNA preQ1(34) S-adenosylmethionine ribosyltransferase-isomerase QueA [Deltaproteobacteria bacterium]